MDLKSIARGPWLPVAIAIVARAVAVVAHGLTRNDFPDGGDYVRIAVELVRDGHYAEYGHFLRAPLFPLSLTPWAWFGPDAVVVGAKLGNVALGAWSAWLAYAVFAKYGTRAAWLAALSVALQPTLLMFSTMVGSETLYVACVLGSTLAVARLAETPSRAAAVTAGVWLGLSALARPQALAVGGALLVTLVAVAWRGRSLRARLRDGAVVALVLALTIAPWTLRNWFRYGELIPVSDGAGITLSLAHSDFGFRLQRADSADAYRRLEREMYDVELPRLYAETDGLPPRARDQALSAQAWRWAVAHPLQLAEAVARRTAHFCAPWVSPDAYSTRTAALTALWFVPLFLLGGFGLFEAQRRGDTIAWIALVNIAVTVLTVGALMHSVQRYRIPNVDVFLGMLAATKLGSLLRRAAA